ncbi:MAG: L-aspartate oxidase [Wenzhouxiangella sp.]
MTTGRVVIVGAGLGGLYAALCLAPRPVLVISPESLGQGASSAWAQGGVAAAMAQSDSPQAHADDTVAAGAGTVDREIAQLVTAAAPDQIRDLSARGTLFDRDEAGHYLLNHEAAHSQARVVRVKGDQTGREVMRALVQAVRDTPTIQVLEGVVAQDLLLQDGQVCGVALARLDAGAISRPIRLQAPAVLLAGGGSGGLYALTTNPPSVRGQVAGLAARAGALMADMEFVQFHPTAIDAGLDPAPLATEALRGAGALLINADGERFMQAEHPLAELAPRDIVARAVFAQTESGRRPMLDTRLALGDAILRDYPSVVGACHAAGIDPVLSPIPIAVAAHYHMGGVASDAAGRSSLPGLWVCGESAATGLHGANRLASNGVLEALVFARRAAADLGAGLTISPAITLDLRFVPGGVPLAADAVASLRELMTRWVGVRRSADGLIQALGEIRRLATAHADCVDFRNMCATAWLIATAALHRQESRGAHWRDDFPQSDPAQAQRSRLHLDPAWS